MVSNVTVACFLALLAVVVHRFTKRPAIAHLLWLVVLVKLVTPPLFHLPLVPNAWASAAANEAEPTRHGVTLPPEPGFAPTNTASDSTAAIGGSGGPSQDPGSLFAAEATSSWLSPLLWLWLLGSAVVLIWSLSRIVRFNRALRRAAEPAPERLLRMGQELSATLGLRRTPAIQVTPAQTSPMVWWVGGRVQVVIPEALITVLDDTQMRSVLAHELAHVRRGDHIVRWLEWICCVVLWWNPLTYWARRNLRIHEETCCDALVLESFEVTPVTYANSLLQVLEFLAKPLPRPPALASPIHGGSLERRFQMMLSNPSTTPRWVLRSLFAGALALLPLGVAQAQSADFDAVATRLQDAVAAGELSSTQAAAMMGTLGRLMMTDRLDGAVSNSGSAPNLAPDFPNISNSRLPPAARRNLTTAQVRDWFLLRGDNTAPNQTPAPDSAFEKPTFFRVPERSQPAEEEAPHPRYEALLPGGVRAKSNEKPTIFRVPEPVQPADQGASNPRFEVLLPDGTRAKSKDQLIKEYKKLWRKIQKELDPLSPSDDAPALDPRALRSFGIPDPVKQPDATTPESSMFDPRSNPREARTRLRSSINALNDEPVKNHDDPNPSDNERRYNFESRANAQSLPRRFGNRARENNLNASGSALNNEKRNNRK